MKRDELKIASFFLIAMFSLTLVSALGVTYPQPQNIELKPGESSYFTFQIQASDFALTCVPIIEETQGLELAFNPNYEVEANQRYNVKPQVIVPKQTPFGTYTAKFCMECTPSAEVEGSKIIPRVCGLPVSVTVVSERTRENMFEQQPTGYVVWVIMLTTVILILAATIFYLVQKRKRGIPSTLSYKY